MVEIAQPPASKKSKAIISAMIISIRLLCFACGVRREFPGPSIPGLVGLIGERLCVGGCVPPAAMTLATSPVGSVTSTLLLL